MTWPKFGRDSIDGDIGRTDVCRVFVLRVSVAVQIQNCADVPVGRCRVYVDVVVGLSDTLRLIHRVDVIYINLCIQCMTI